MSDSSMDRHAPAPDAIAVIGMGCRFPGADSPDVLWRNLLAGVDSVSEAPRDRSGILDLYDPDRQAAGKSYSRWGGFLKNQDLFDAGFFRMSPREAELLDPQQRLFLEVAWETLESAGYADDRLRGSNAGVFVGAMASEYLPSLVGDLKEIRPHTVTGNHASMIANRLSYFLGLEGPSLTLDAACASSIVALHQAMQSLRQGECSFAFVGGTQAGLAPFHWVEFSRLGALSPTGRCRAFAKDADGYVVSEGVACLLLRPLEAALHAGDEILAVVRGTAVGHGGTAPGLTVPSSAGQSRTFERALRSAGVRAGELSYVEAHGTGTPLGDPIEFQGLWDVLRAEGVPPQSCALGSIKTNIGHTESAAGLAGLLKVILSFRHRTIPASLHFTAPNPKIAFESSPFYLPDRPVFWPAIGPRRSAIHASGFGGAVAFAIVEEAPAVDRHVERERPIHLIRLSAATDRALAQSADRLANWLEESAGRESSASLANVAYSSNVGRGLFEHRLLARGTTPDELARSLRRFGAGSLDVGVASAAVRERAKLAFLFTGQGSHRWGMARELFETSPTFRQSMESSASQLADEFSIDLLGSLYGDDRSLLDQTAIHQPAIFAVQRALAACWSSWGIEAESVLGHSLGEFAAACSAGVMSWEDGLRLVAHRGRLMQQLPEGAMSAVFAEEEQVATLLTEVAVDVAARNGPGQRVVSGSVDAIHAFESLAERQGLRCHRLSVSRAYHSSLIEPMLPEFRDIVSRVPMRAPARDWVSSRTGDVVRATPTADDWCRQIRQPVEFDRAVRTLLSLETRAFLEVGPTATLSNMARAIAGSTRDDLQWMATLRPDRDDWNGLFDALTTLELCGHSFDGRGFDRDYSRRRVELPGYPFDRKRYWVDPPVETTVVPRTDPVPPAEPAHPQAEDSVRIERLDWRQVPSWPARPCPAGIWLVAMDADGRCLPIVQRLRASGSLVAEIHRGANYDRPRSGVWQVGSDRKDWQRVLDEVTALGPPVGVVFGWPIEEMTGPCSAAVESILPFMQALTSFERQPIELTLLAKNSLAISDVEAVDPARGSLWGFWRTLAVEYPGWKFRGLDVDSSAGSVVDLVLQHDLPEVGALRGGVGWQPRLIESSEPKQLVARRGSGAVVVSGGLGEFGRGIARELVARGCRSIALLSRSGASDQPRESFVEELRQAGATVWTPSVDVSDRDALATTLSTIRERMGGVSGVIHAAGVLVDKLTRNLSSADLETVWKAKALGAKHLDELTATDSLSMFVLVSSIVSIEANIGQGAYASANAFLDALAQRRRSKGQVATSVHVGPLDAGMADHGRSLGRWASLGLVPIETVAAARRLIDLAEAPSGEYAIVHRMSGHEFAESAPVAPDPPVSLEASKDSVDTLIGTVRQVLSEVLHVPAEELDTETPFQHFGLDSILAEEVLAKFRMMFTKRDWNLPVLFAYPTIRTLAEHLQSLPGLVAPSPVSTHSSPRSEFVERRSETASVGDIAVIGYAGRFPGANSAEEFWRLLDEGACLIGPAPEERWRLLKRYYPWKDRPDRPVGGWLTGIDLFDPYFFGLRPAEADHMDPRQRLFLEVAYRAIEHAGYGRERLANTRTGTFVGAGAQDYSLLEAIPPEQMNEFTGLGSTPSVVASRLAYFLNWKGPCLAFDTACSSGLVAVHEAMNSLRRREVDTAIAGAVHINLSGYVPSVLDRLGVVSRSGRCQPFGAGADGFVPGEAVAAVVLKRLDDARGANDRIIAVLKGSAVNNDGRTVGLAAPSPAAQAEVIGQACRDARIDERSIQYIEAHGTATSVGDAIELDGLARAFGNRKSAPGGQSQEARSSLAIGSVKSNMGHADIAAGLVGLIKVLMALEHGRLPASLSADPPNPALAPSAGGLRVITRPEPWTAERPRRAGVSSFGFAGTNAHVIVEEAPAQTSTHTDRDEAIPFFFSAPTEAGLHRHLNQHADWLRSTANASLWDVGFTLAIGRRHQRVRCVVVARSRDELMERLERWVSADGSLAHGDDLSPSFRPVVEAFLRGEEIDPSQMDWPKHCRPVPIPGAMMEPIRCWYRPSESAELKPLVPVHRIRWTQGPIPEHADRAPSGPCSVIGSIDDPWTAGIARHNQPSPVRTYEQLQAGGGWASILANNPRVIIWVLGAGQTTDDQLAKRVEDVRELSRGIQSLGSRSAPAVIIITRGGQQVRDGDGPACPTASAIDVLAMVLSRETAASRVLTVDVDDRCSADSLRTLDALTRTSSGRWAIRSGMCYRPEMVAADMLAKRSGLQRGGVYLVTGALGGIGRRLTHWLAQKYRAQVILAARGDRQRALPSLAEIESASGSALFVPTDVRDADQVRHAVDVGVRTFGTLNGVFHLAGSAEHARLSEQTNEMIQRSTRAKVGGALHLESATRGLSLDQLVLFASVAGVYGNAFQASYSAANRWLDAFAERRNQNGLATWSLDWGLWADVGLGAELAHRPEWADQAMSPQAALETMDHVLRMAPGRYLITSTPPVMGAASSSVTNSDRSNDIEQPIRVILSGVLGIPQSKIDRDSVFVDLGMDSRTAVEFVHQLESRFHLKLPISLPFDYPTVRRLAEHIEQTGAILPEGDADEARGQAEPTSKVKTTGVLKSGRRFRVVDSMTWKGP